jgi:hypothetical protein
VRSLIGAWREGTAVEVLVQMAPCTHTCHCTAFPFPNTTNTTAHSTPAFNALCTTCRPPVPSPLSPHPPPYPSNQSRLDPPPPPNPTPSLTQEVVVPLAGAVQPVPHHAQHQHLSSVQLVEGGGRPAQPVCQRPGSQAVQSMCLTGQHPKALTSTCAAYTGPRSS